MSDLGCEEGDLSGRFTSIELAGNNQMQKYFFTGNIPLSGAYSVISRSIVIHDKTSGAARYACADINTKVCLLSQFSLLE